MTDTPQTLAARVVLRPIGGPLPLGMAGLAIASFVTSGLELHWIVSSQAVDVGLILVSVPFILQLLACVFSYLARDGAAGSLLAVVSTTWLGMGLIRIVSTPGKVSGALGLLLVAAGALLALCAPAVGRAKPLPALVFLAAAVRFGLAGVYELSGTSAWQNASGVVGLAVVGLACYSMLAFELEDQSRAAVLPTFRRGQGAASLNGGVDVQLDRVINEAGVRQTS